MGQRVFVLMMTKQVTIDTVRNLLHVYLNLSIGCNEETIVPMPSTPQKTADDRVPLPNPFPLPKHFRTDVYIVVP